MADVTPHLRVYYGRILTVSAADNRSGPVLYSADGYASWGSQDYIKIDSLQASNIPAKDAVVLSAKVGDDCEIWCYTDGTTRLYPKTLVIPFRNCSSPTNVFGGGADGEGGAGGPSDGPPGGGGGSPPSGGIGGGIGPGGGTD